MTFPVFSALYSLFSLCKYDRHIIMCALISRFYLLASGVSHVTGYETFIVFVKLI